MPPANAKPEHTREPCPDRIIDDIGGAFGMGCVGSAVYNFITGTMKGPKGGKLPYAYSVRSVTMCLIYNIIFLIFKFHNIW